MENRHFNHWNTDPWQLDYGGQGDELAAGTVFLLLPVGRRVLQDRIRPMLGRVVPRLISVLQQPKRLSIGLSGNLLLNLSYIACLVASVRAFGGGLSIASIGVVYLAGSAVGSAVPMSSTAARTSRRAMNSGSSPPVSIRASQ